MNRVNRIAIGTANFGESYGISEALVSSAERESIIDTCVENNIITFDTSQLYHNAEVTLRYNSKLEMNVVSKFTLESLSIGQNVKNLLNQSLDKIDQKQLYGFLFHRAGEINTPLGKKCLLDLIKLKQDGLVKKIGVSIYSPKELSRVLDVFTPDLIQFPFNVFDQRMLHYDHFDNLKNLGIELHSRSVFLQGLLLANTKNLPDKFTKWQSHFAKFDRLCKKYNRSKLEICLEFVFGQAWIDKIVLGVNSTQQLKMIIDVLKRRQIQLECKSLAAEDLHLINPSNWTKT